MEDPILHGRRKPPNVSVEAAMAEGFQHSTLNCEKKGKMKPPWYMGNEVSLTCAGPGRGERKGGGHFLRIRPGIPLIKSGNSSRVSLLIDIQ